MKKKSSRNWHTQKLPTGFNRFDIGEKTSKGRFYQYINTG